MAFYSACAALVLSLAGSAVADCQSYGVDYEDGGTYFQNSNTNETFTALQMFNGCSNDTSHNILVDPKGDQSECTQTSMLPNNASQLITCSDWSNKNLYSGAWSILVISNNNNESAIAFQRDFELDVGAPNATVTANPETTNTVYATATSYVSVTSYVPTTSYIDNNAEITSTVTSGSYATGTTITTGMASEFEESGLSAFATITRLSSQTYIPDPIARIFPSILGDLDDVAASVIRKARNGGVQARATPMPMSAKFKRAVAEGREVTDQLKAAFVEERAALLQNARNIAKRHPDNFTTTVIQEITSYVSTAVLTTTLYSTTTEVGLVGRDVQTASTSTATLPSTVWDTFTETPACANGAFAQRF
ncbi:Hypothetical predicted protein [Lecanosticta acicola]|uniref:Uncharacterized protein n=1 Tax=Lecanosticta acicola TaxID=111012 RepID=A0AAI8Z3C4_9PEZI|nr:Hypothetical predicted protein [Lecanosticta acicola]